MIFVICLVISAGSVIAAEALCETQNIASSMENLQVVPDVIDAAPAKLLKVTYGELSVDLGKELTPTQVKSEPAVTWEADAGAFYTLCMTDPDAPSRAAPRSREFHHWLVANIPENRVAEGETLTAYVGSGPPRGTGLHRYVFLVYKQPGRLTFNEPRISNRTLEGRPQFSVRNFAAKHGLGPPVAGNFYQAQYDDYVPTVHAQLGL